MITFNEFMKQKLGEEMVGLYPPAYNSVGLKPLSAVGMGTDAIYVRASRKSVKKRRKHKKK